MFGRFLLLVFGGLVAFVAPAIPASAQSYVLDNDLSPEMTAGCAENVSAPAARSQPLPNAVKILPPSNGVYLGTYQIPTGQSEIAQFANALGQTPPIVFSFHDLYAEDNSGRTPDRTMNSAMEGGGNRSNPLQLGAWLNQNGSALAMSWAVYCCDIEKLGFWLRTKKPHEHFNRIISGEYDAVLRENARLIRDMGAPIMLTVVPEFNWQGHVLFGSDGLRWMDAVENICNQYGDPSWPDGPERIRDTIMHVIDIFRDEGVTNVTWMMYAANRYMHPTDEGQSKWLHPKYYYPGDAYIDWVGQSVYYTAPEWVGNYEELGTFDQVFMRGYEAWRSVTKRPLLLAEFGILAEHGADRSGLWRELLTDQLRSLRGVGAVTIADTLLFQEYFDIPMLSTNVTEAGVVKDLIEQDSFFRQPLRTGPASANRNLN